MKNLKRRLCGLLLTAAMTLSLCCPALAAELAFPDTKDHWAADIIQTLASDGIVNGYGDGKCHPDAPITRGQFAALVARALKLTPKSDSAMPFVDLAGHWCADYVLALAGAGIILPADYGSTYEPDKEITRMEMVVIMVRALGKESEAEKKQGQTKFKDDGVSSQVKWAKFRHKVYQCRGEDSPGSIPAEKLVSNGLVVLQSVAGAGHVNDLAAVDEAVKDSGGNGGVAKEVGPLVKALVGGNNQ